MSNIKEKNYFHAKMDLKLITQNKIKKKLVWLSKILQNTAYSITNMIYFAYGIFLFSLPYEIYIWYMCQ